MCFFSAEISCSAPLNSRLTCTGSAGAAATWSATGPRVSLPTAIRLEARGTAPVIDHVVKFDLPPAARRVYDALEEEMVARIDGIVRLLQREDVTG